MRHTWLQNNKWRDVETYLKNKKTVIIPVGSTEQHGHHLPMGTDSYVSIRVAEDAAERTNTLIVPPTWFGLAPHHMAYPGTITLRGETLTHLLVDILQSLVYHGFEKMIVLNGHREANLPPLKLAATKIRNHTGAFVVIADPFYIAREVVSEMRQSEPGGVGHADELETSHMLFLYPELCAIEQAVKNTGSPHRFLQHDPFAAGDTVFLPSDVATYRERTNGVGVGGDPTVSSKENGEKYHQYLVNNLVELVEYCEQEVEVTLRNRNIPL